MAWNKIREAMQDGAFDKLRRQLSTVSEPRQPAIQWLPTDRRIQLAGALERGRRT